MADQLLKQTVREAKAVGQRETELAEGRRHSLLAVKGAMRQLRARGAAVTVREDAMRHREAEVQASKKFVIKLQEDVLHMYGGSSSSLPENHQTKISQISQDAPSDDA